MEQPTLSTFNFITKNPYHEDTLPVAILVAPDGPSYTLAQTVNVKPDNSTLDDSLLCSYVSQTAENVWSHEISVTIPKSLFTLFQTGIDREVWTVTIEYNHETTATVDPRKQTPYAWSIFPKNVIKSIVSRQLCAPTRVLSTVTRYVCTGLVYLALDNVAPQIDLQFELRSNYSYYTDVLATLSVTFQATAARVVLRASGCDIDVHTTSDNLLLGPDCFPPNHEGDGELADSDAFECL